MFKASILPYPNISNQPPTDLPQTMKAWQYSSTSGGGLVKHLRLNPSATVPPLPAPPSKSSWSSVTSDPDGPRTHLLIQVHAMALNPVDYKLPGMLCAVPVLGSILIPRPATPGIDFAGKIHAISRPGPPEQPTSKLQEGQHVFGRLSSPVRNRYGTLAEYTVVQGNDCAVLPNDVVVGPSTGKRITIEEAASIATAGRTAYQSLVPYIDALHRSKKSDARPNVFINGGSGGCGTYAIQMASKCLNCHVVTTCSSRNVKLCHDLGADIVIDYTAKDPVTELIEMASNKNNAGKFDLVIDFVGGVSNIYSQMHRFSTPEATYVQVGAELGPSAVTATLKRMLVPGFLGGGKRKYALPVVTNKTEAFEKIAQWIVEGKVTALIEKVYEMDEQGEDGPIGAFERLMTGRTQGKLVVRVKKD